MNKKTAFIVGGIGCGLVIFLVAIGALALVFLPWPLQRVVERQPEPTTQPTWTPVPGAVATQEAIPTLTPPSPAQAPVTVPSLAPLYDRLNPGVVNIQVYVQRQGIPGAGGGSGFILDVQGHIVTNNHVVASADQITAIFYDGTEAKARVIGADADSDLAVIQVENLPQGVHPLPLGDSDRVQVGEWVIAIGNPFGLGSSMTLGIVSALGRTIPSGATSFSIPEAIQTDAAINPGNSGGPLLNLAGEVIGVNAQIASGGSQANAGVGFAIPANIVRRVAPALIASGSYQWPWLGVRGGSVNLAIVKANDLPVNRGAYIHAVVSGGPADQAGMQGSTGTVEVDGFDVPVGGDVIVEVDGQPITDFSALLVHVSGKLPGESIALTILRDGERQQIAVELEPRPSGSSEGG